MSRISNAQPSDLRLPDELGLSPEVEAEVRGEAWSMVVRGQDDADEFVELWADELADWGLTEEAAVTAFTHVLEARREQQAAWAPDARTSLTEAFDELNRSGIVAREDFSCCGSCASGEIWGERDDTRTWRGYVTYNEQDTENLVESRSVYLSYGAFMDAWISEADWEALSSDQKDAKYTDTVTRLMVEEVLPAFERHGITATWNRDLGTRILLENADFYAAV